MPNYSFKSFKLLNDSETSINEFNNWTKIVTNIIYSPAVNEELLQREYPQYSRANLEKTRTDMLEKLANKIMQKSYIDVPDGYTWVVRCNKQKKAFYFYNGYMEWAISTKYPSIESLSAALEAYKSLIDKHGERLKSIGMDTPERCAKLKRAKEFYDFGLLRIKNKKVSEQDAQAFFAKYPENADYYREALK